MNKLNELLDMLNDTESAEFSIAHGIPEIDGKHCIELHLIDWYKTIYEDSWEKCIDNALEFMKSNNLKRYGTKTCF